MNNVINLIMLILATIVSLVLFFLIKKNNTKNQLTRIFMVNIILILIWIIPLIGQILFAEKFNINPIIFDYFTYIGACFLPIGIFFTSLIFENTKIKFKKWYLLLFIIPVLTLLILWTNDFHHLFYINYSTSIAETIVGPYANIHSVYNAALYAIALINLMRYSIKNSGFFSKQAILFTIATLIPFSANFLGTFVNVNISIYITPILFTITLFLCALAIFKFDFLRTAPIALQRIVDRMSDGYVVLDENNMITDFNETFLKTFHFNATTARNKDFIKLIQLNDADLDKLILVLQKSKKSPKTFIFEKRFEKLNKYFHIEINSITNKGSFLGILILFKDITQHMEDMNTIKENQNLLIERERLASLGQMIGRYCSQLKNTYYVHFWCSRRSYRLSERI